MEETLKSVRSIHLVVIGLCVAIAIFAASPRSDIYGKAKAELEALREVRLEELRAEIERDVRKLTDDLPWLEPATLFPNGQVLPSLSPAALFHIRYNESAVAKLEAGAPLEDWFSFLAAPLRVAIYLPDPADPALSDFLADLKQFARTKPNPRIESLSFKEPGLQANESITSLPVYAICASDAEKAAPVFTKTVRAVETEVVEDLLSAWVETADSTAKLRAVAGTGSPWLKQLSAIRNEIGSLKISDAAQYLELRMSSQKRKIDVLGTSIDEELAIIAGPLALLLTVVYFVFNLAHLARLLLASATEARSFPWIGLFPGRVVGSVVYASMWLPLAISLWLLLFSWSSASRPALTGASTLTAALLACAVAGSRALATVRRSMAVGRATVKAAAS